MTGKFLIIKEDIEHLHDPMAQISPQCYKYTDCCGTTYFQSYPFSEEQIKKIEEEAKRILDIQVEGITDEINKRILERIINNKK
jgi:hypothetical protein